MMLKTKAAEAEAAEAEEREAEAKILSLRDEIANLNKNKDDIGISVYDFLECAKQNACETRTSIINNLDDKMEIKIEIFYNTGKKIEKILELELFGYKDCPMQLNFRSSKIEDYLSCKVHRYWGDHVEQYAEAAKKEHKECMFAIAKDLKKMSAACETNKEKLEDAKEHMLGILDAYKRRAEYLYIKNDSTRTTITSTSYLPPIEALQSNIDFFFKEIKEEAKKNVEGKREMNMKKSLLLNLRRLKLIEENKLIALELRLKSKKAGEQV